jgi:hypothetical protein
LQKIISKSEKGDDLIKLFWVFAMLLFVAVGLAAHTALGAPMKVEPILLSAPNLYGQNFFTILINSPDPKQAPKNLRVFSKETFKDATAEIIASQPEKLRTSASGEFSKGQLEYIISKLSTEWAPDSTARNIHVVDLSSRAHGFVNNMQVVWLDKNLSSGTDAHAFIDEEKNLLEGLKKSKKLSLYTLPETVPYTDLSTAEMAKLGAKHVDVQVDAVETEAHYLKEKRIAYSRIVVTANDLAQLEDHQVDLFAHLVKKMKKDEWLHFHSEDGAQKLSMALTLTDVLKNAPSLSLSEILDRQNFISRQAKMDLFTTGAKLENIYDYAKEQSPEFKVSWVNWQKTHLIGK